MKATELLLNQHRDVRQLFEQLETGDEADKKALREQLAQNIVAHSVIEKEIFYPALKERAAEAGLVDLSYVEHGIVEYALSQLLSTRPADESFRPKVTVLKDLVLKHVEEEENEMLPQAESLLGAENLEQLGEQMEARFMQVSTKGYKSFLKQALAETAPRTMSRATRAPAKKTASKAQASNKRAPARRAPTRGASQARQSAKQSGTTSRKSSTRGSRQGRASSR